MDRELKTLCLTVLALLLLGSAALASQLGMAPALLCLLVSTGTWLIIYRAAWNKREKNRPSEDAPMHMRLGSANRITLLRGALIAMLAGFLVLPHANTALVWIAAGLYSMAAILDRLDGYIARISKSHSLMGAELDTFVDALGLLIAPVLALMYGKIHPLYLLASLAFYLFTLGLNHRIKNGLRVAPLPPSKRRRIFAGFQMGFIAFALFPPFQSEQTVIVSLVFLTPLLIGFIIDWMVVSTFTTPQRMESVLSAPLYYLETVLLPLLRLGIVVGLVFFALESAIPMAQLFIIGAVVLALLLGILSTVANCIVLLLLCSLWSTDLPALHSTSLLIAASFSAILGAGKYSLLRWDDHWIARRDGEAQ
ncbi:MAG: CDP-alcohol phosphatidyltransferase family protein [Pseudohongiellaceae bacterium]|nr:CDP-alcohol phosphatidyltransferase family protein [Pseudohongiellaceae bacterium]